MRNANFAFYGKQAVIYNNGIIPDTSEELVMSGLFEHVFRDYMQHLREKDSPLFEIVPKGISGKKQDNLMLMILRKLTHMRHDEVAMAFPNAREVFRDTYMLNEFVEKLYNFWRSFERFFICYSLEGGGEDQEYDKRPYRTFNHTIEILNHLTRKAYRDICENITGNHPRVYRQVAAGCQIGVIAGEKEIPLSKKYANLSAVPVIRQVFMSPPLILDPTMNKRAGIFREVKENPLEGVDFSSGEWLCYPAKVCDTLIHVFFHSRFMGLSTSLANLFDLADDEDLRRKPDAIYAFGVPIKHMKKYGKNPTVFFEDKKNELFVGAVPGDDSYGYFGYLKKMILTLHNIVSIKKGRLPVHGAMVRISMKNRKTANVLVWGDSGAGKSETLEAFRMLGRKYIRDMTVIFDDMGSLGIGSNGKVVAYGTETGAFVRLDDLQPGFAFGNMDRTIIHSPYTINSRAILPITTQYEVTKGHEIDFLLYANNYESVDTEHSILERFSSIENALKVFREGARMAKGTTTETGLVYSFFANPFGPAQYKDEYEKLAKKYFEKVFASKAFVGQLRTRLGISGMETKGPQEAAKELFRIISG